jgi:drug/metabolite transporter superfamily protein YnfA
MLAGDRAARPAGAVERAATAIGRGMTQAGSPSQRDWLIPSAAMTAGLMLAAIALMPAAGYSGMPPYLMAFARWVKLSAFGGVFIIGWLFWRMHREGVENPLSEMKRRFVARIGAHLAVIAGMLLAGIDMQAFMWIKPEVTAVAPFWADPWFADMDHALFGVDPWRLFIGIDLTFHAWAYSFFWALAIMAALIWLFASPASPGRSRAIVSYFATWSIFGPLGQLAFSAAGPIFYQRAGFGDRFAAMDAQIPEVTQRIAGYLWTYHEKGTFAFGAGVSAMPSLHIATVTWIVLTAHELKSRLVWPAALFALYIFALSVALGWHYAVDGLAGAAGAWVCHAAAGRYLAWRSAAPQGTLVPVAHFTGR